ncbi:hypothetical protein [Nocardia sp. CDC160]|uniref:hypothetical protein n=1 Tax=Nocardia sp. CDC160 TaxID=3112166 RepID=UPI002DB9E0D2|nr:hypothetical protein [Nocardia sp. CDC160]MEC3919555.1 hypothetical protein [Nocardia sp. CDC160]
MLIVIGLIAAVAGWGSSQRLSLLEPSAPIVASATGSQFATDSGHSAADPAPACKRQEYPASDPTGSLATPPRAIGDQLVADFTRFEPEPFTPHSLSIGKQPRAPTLPVAAPHLTTVLII